MALLAPVRNEGRFKALCLGTHAETFVLTSLGREWQPNAFGLL